MAEEKKTPAKVEESKLAKVLNWFKKLPGRIAKPFKNMVAELKKVTWPSKKKWISSSIMVLVFMLFMGVVIGLLDLGATALVNTMSPDPVAQNQTTEDHDHDHDHEEVVEGAEVTEGAEEQNAEAADEVTEEATEAAEAEATEAADETPAE